jgi:DNA modification methylase
MSDHLSYWWIGGMGHGTNLNRMHGAKVTVAWKPALWFVKDFHRGIKGRYPVDFRDGEARDKRYHEWGQPVDWFAHWIERLTEPAECVLDPTSGAGSVLVASKELGRRAIGVELSRTHVRTASRRLAATETPKAA